MGLVDVELESHDLIIVDSLLSNSCEVFDGFISSDDNRDLILLIIFVKYFLDNRSLFLKEELDKKFNFYDFLNFKSDQDIGVRLDEFFEFISTIDFSVSFKYFSKLNISFKNFSHNGGGGNLLKRLLSTIFRMPCLNKFDNSSLINFSINKIIDHFSKDSTSTTRYHVTPFEVSSLLASLLEPKEYEKIYDPCSGTGSNLLLCSRFFSKKSRALYLYGQEKNYSLCIVSLILLTCNSEENFSVLHGDTISNPLFISGDKLMLFDVVLGVPPFGMDKINYENFEGDKYDRFSWGIPPNNRSEYAFISHMIKSANPETGRIGVVVPHGVLFRSSFEGYIRKQLIEDGLLDAVIGLPDKLFYGSPMPVAILFFKMGKKDNNVIFIDASNDVEIHRGKNLLSKSSLDKIVDVYKNRRVEYGYSYVANFEEIKAKGFNLNIPLYFDSKSYNDDYSLEYLKKERSFLIERLNSVSSDSERLLDDLLISLNMKNF